MRRLMPLAVLGALATVGTSVGDTWWWDFEFDDPNDLPQGEGWARMRAPWPDGCNPTIEGGCLKYDSDDPQSYDWFRYESPGRFSCGPSELFVIEWRLLVTTVSLWGDPGLEIHTDDARLLTLV